MNSVITYPPGCKDIQVELANDELIRRLKKIQQQFQLMDQSADNKYKELAIFLGSEFFLEHYNEDVQLLVACCLGDVFRVYAPDYPFQDPNNLKNIFMFLANQLKGLKYNSNAAFKRYFYLLENLECVRTFLICQELDDSQEVIVNLFENVFKIVNDKTIQRVRQLFFDLLHPLLNDADQISTKVLDLLFARIIEPAKSNNKEAYTLAVNLLKKGNQHFEYLVQNHLNSTVLVGRGSTSHNLTISNFNESNLSSVNIDDSNQSDEILNSSLNNIAGQSSEAAKAAGVHGAGSSNQFITDKLCLIIYEINQIRPALLELVMPQLEYKLKSNDQKERREYTRLLSKMFSEKDSKLAEQVPQLWEAYLERFADMNDDIRKICIQHICDFLIQQSEAFSKSASNTSVNHHSIVSSSSSTKISEQIIEQVKSRSLDPDEALRFEVVQEILKAIKMSHNLVTSDLLNILKERTLDIKIKIRKSALQGLAQLYKKVHAKNNSRDLVRLHKWIPSTILKIYFQESIEDKLMVERFLNSCIVPYTLGAREKMAQLYYAFTTFDDYSILSLIEIMKNRVLLYQLMKSIIDLNDSKTTENTTKLESEIMLVSNHLLDTTKGNEFMKILLNLFKKNLNLKNYFKNFVNLSCSASKSMQLIQLIFTNLNTLNTTQMSMARRLIERMSSLIIDKECLEMLIELVEYKVKQKLTPEQRRMLKKKVLNSTKSKQKTSGKKKTRTRSFRENDEDSDLTDNEYCDLSSEEESLDELRNDENDVECCDEDERVTFTTETSNREDTEDFRDLLKYIDDDGEKGLKLINIILMIHQNYGFANPTTYEKMFILINSRKDHIVSSNLKFLSHHFTKTIRLNYSAEETVSFETTNKTYLEKLKYLVRNGKPKQVKYAIYVIYNNFDKDQCETILHDLYNDLYKEAIAKNVKTFVQSLIGLGHIAMLIPAIVGKDMKDFVVQIIAKDMLLNSPSLPFNVSLNESATTTQRRKNNLKLAGKWCDNEDEFPFNTRARIEGIKLITRWCLGLKSECTNITTSLRLFTKLIKDNSSDQPDEDNKQAIVVTAAERSRIRSVCGNQIVKLAQENSFKPLITAEYFHVVARLIIDPVTNVRDILIKKIQKGLTSYKLPIYYMSMFALSGLDTNRERKTRIKKIYSSLIAKIRLNDIKNQKKQLESKVQRTRILPEMCLPYAVSLLAHNTHIDSLKEDTKVKQVKECMAVILDPLIEKIDSYQVAYIKKILNKIKISDDGIASFAITNASNASNQSAVVNKATIHNLYSLNKKLCLICEIFLFHMYSKSTTYLAAKEYEFDVKLPTGFYATRDNNSESSIKIDRFNSEENMKKLQAKETEEDDDTNSEANSDQIEVDKENLSVNSKPKGSRIEIISRKRPSTDTPDKLSKAKKSPEKSKDESNDSLNRSPPPSKRNKPNVKSPAKEAQNINESLEKSPTPKSKVSPVRKSMRGKKVEETINETEAAETNENEDDEQKEEDASISSRRSSRRAATPSTPVINNAKASSVTKSSKKKSQEQEKPAEKVSERPTRSLRTTRASANK